MPESQFWSWLLRLLITNMENWEEWLHSRGLQAPQDKKLFVVDWIPIVKRKLLHWECPLDLRISSISKISKISRISCADCGCVGRSQQPHGSWSRRNMDRSSTSPSFAFKWLIRLVTIQLSQLFQTCGILGARGKNSDFGAHKTSVGEEECISSPVFWFSSQSSCFTSLPCLPGPVPAHNDNGSATWRRVCGRMGRTCDAAMTNLGPISTRQFQNQVGSWG